MNFVPVSIYRAIFSGSFYTACIFSAFLVRFLRRFVLLIFHAIFFQFFSSSFVLQFQHLLHVLSAFSGNVVQRAMVCKRRQKERWVSVIYTLFQRTFWELWTGNCLLEKYYIRLPRIFVIFLSDFGCVCVRFDLFLYILYFYLKLFIRVNIYRVSVYTKPLFRSRLEAVTQFFQSESNLFC